MASTTIPNGLEIRRLCWKDDSFRQADHEPTPKYGMLGWWDNTISGGNAITFSNTGSSLVTSSNPVYGGVVTPGVFGLESPAFTNGDELYLPAPTEVEKDFPVGIPVNIMAFLRLRARNAGLGTSTLTVILIDSSHSPLAYGTFTITLASSLYTHYSLPIFFAAGHYDATGSCYGIIMYCSNGAVIDYVALASDDFINQGGQSLDVTIPKKTDSQAVPMSIDIIQQMGISSRSKAVTIPKISTTAYRWLEDKMDRSIPLELVTPTQQATGYLSDQKRHSEAGWVGVPLPSNDSLAITARTQQLYDVSFSLIKADNEVNIDLTCPVLPPTPPYPDINTQFDVAVTVGFNDANDMPMILFANGLFWVFYSGNADKCYYKTSSDGNTWSTTHLLSSSFTLGYGGGVLYYPHLNRFYYGFYQMDINIFYWRWGTPNANGTIAWGISEQNFATPYAYEFPTFDVDSTGLFWTATLYGAPFSGGIQDWAIWKNSALNLTVPQSGVDTSWNIGSPKLMVSKSNANNVCFFGKELATQSTLYYTTNGGTSWSNFNMPRVFNQTYADAVVVGNVVYIVYPQNSGGTGNVYFVTYNIGDGATSSEKLLGTIPVGSVSPGVSITTNQVNDLVVVWADQLSNIYRTLSHNLGAIWDAPKVMIAISGTIGALPVSVFDLTSYNQVLALAYLGPFNGAGFPLFAGGASFT